MTPVQAQLFLLSNGANETHTDGCRNLDVRATASRPPRPDPPLAAPCLSSRFFSPASCVAPPFLFVDIAKRAEEKMRGRTVRAVFFFSCHPTPTSLASTTGGKRRGGQRETTTGRRAWTRIATPVTYGATGNREPPFHRFLALPSAFSDPHTCAFPLC